MSCGCIHREMGESLTLTCRHPGVHVVERGDRFFGKWKRVQVPIGPEFRRHRGEMLAGFELLLPDRLPPALVRDKCTTVLGRGGMWHLRALLVAYARVDVLRTPRDSVKQLRFLIEHETLADAAPVGKVARETHVWELLD